MGFFVSRISNHTEKAILNVVTCIQIWVQITHSLSYSWFFFTAPSAAYNIYLCLLSTESPFPPLPVCSNCRNNLCCRSLPQVEILVQYNTHTHSYLSLLPLKGHNRSRYKSSYMQISVVRGDESYSSRNRIDIYAYIRSKPHLGWLRQICVATIGMTFSSTREKWYGSILVALKCVPGN